MVVFIELGVSSPRSDVRWVHLLLYRCQDKSVCLALARKRGMGSGLAYIRNLSYGYFDR